MSRVCVVLIILEKTFKHIRAFALSGKKRKNFHVEIKVKTTSFPERLFFRIFDINNGLFLVQLSLNVAQQMVQLRTERQPHQIIFVVSQVHIGKEWNPKTHQNIFTQKEY